MSKPRTQAELDEQARLESHALADYVDQGIQRWKRRYEPQHIGTQYDGIHHSDTKNAEAFPARKSTLIVKGDK